jgi:hypothetical protein
LELVEFYCFSRGRRDVLKRDGCDLKFEDFVVEMIKGGIEIGLDLILA